jgi:hypothetical protein
VGGGVWASDECLSKSGIPPLTRIVLCSSSVLAVTGSCEMINGTQSLVGKRM